MHGAAVETSSSTTNPRVRRSRSLLAPQPRVLSGEDIAAAVVRRVVEGVVARADALRTDELVHETIYAEQRRLAAIGEDPRADADRAFVAFLRHELSRADEERRLELVHAVVERYAAEITGHFDPRVYAVVTRILPHALGVLLAGTGEHHGRNVDDRIFLEGDLGSLRALADRGTVILAPTHVSNLDSLLLGYAIYRLGLPPFAYAAGLNLFSNAVVGVFMKNLGAYTVDRKKSDPLYRETLKEYSTTLVERGQHVLVFPGGTRSRSGLVEKRLKLGLLGTLPLAFRRALEAERPRSRVFVVPCTMSYPLVLEAASLVEDWLRAEGGSHYVDLVDEFGRPRRWLDFIRGLFELDLRVHLRFGRPLDLIGNDVDEEGASYDRRGRRVDPAGYFQVRGRLVEDAARDAEYTRTLASRLVAAYRADTVALPTSVLAFAVFERIRLGSGQSDLFRLLRAIGPEESVSLEQVRTDVVALREQIAGLVSRGAIRASVEVEKGDPGAVIEQALATFGTYHSVPVVERRGDRLRVLDANLLFYYRNRLEGYGLSTAPSSSSSSSSSPLGSS